MIRAYGLSRQLDRAFDTLKQMRLEHVSRSTGVYEALVGACEHFGASVAMVMQVHQSADPIFGNIFRRARPTV